MKLWQDIDKTIPAENDGDPVAVIETSDGVDLISLALYDGDGLNQWVPEGYSAMTTLTPEACAEVREYLSRKHGIPLSTAEE